MQLTEQQVADIFAEVKPALVAQLKTELSQAIEWSAKSTISELVAKELRTWAEENVIPDIRERLTSSKDGILAAVVPATESLAVELGKALAATLAERLNDQYKRREVFKALFGDRY